MKSNPLEPSSAKTQIATTVGTYRKAAPYLKSTVLDYGAGLGLGADELRRAGLTVRTYEPFPERWKSTTPVDYRRLADAPANSFASIICLNVLNVVREDDRKAILRDFRHLLKPGGVAVINARTVADVSKAEVKQPGPEPDSWLIGQGAEARFQRGFTRAKLAAWLRENGWDSTPLPDLGGIAFMIRPSTKAGGNPIPKSNPMTRALRQKLATILEDDDRVLDYDRASGEELYRLYDVVVTDQPLNGESLTEIEGLLDDNGVLVILSGEMPSGLGDHFKRAVRHRGMLLVQHPKNPEEARIKAEEARREA